MGFILSICLVHLFNLPSTEHPLRLSLCEVEYDPATLLVDVHLKLFLTDVNEALVFDPYSTELAFCQPNEASNAEVLLQTYLERYFFIIINGQKMPLHILEKKLAGSGDNTTLGLHFQLKIKEQPKIVEVKNLVFTDLFFDQSNIVYLHIGKKPRSLMLNLESPIHVIEY